LRDLLLREREFLDETRVGFGFLDGVEVGALEILDERELEHVAVAGLAHDDRQRVESRLTRRAPAAFASDELVLAVDQPHDERLDDAALFDGVDQLVEFLRLEILARLERARDDGVARDLPDGLALFLRWLRRGEVDFGRSHQRAKSLPESRRFCHP